ncbi:MAG: arsenite S-adenosylmethyltransferase [Candidatus Margulisiibacteriota bacterium]|nr:MAG: arsenite S-adenosylmethyltransferase [Candidatus Margulisbacteria bacterium GWD2_39_127]PZM83932.1 MAG: arsenite S-adenosylmethyltransferase [Candidatus Margulisiibacteriota bacterium]HAR64178.1 arsenite S-adenosylmethyltransferase [Candidatus Margulisiibacteriota bacterium]HCY36212.1 arsenite S-adenosylmethyltransferase [Candidatus Margulisiibacteriota bacterium]
MSDDVKKIVKDAYTKVVTQSCCGGESACCGGESACCGDEGMNFSPDYSQIDGYVAEADYGLGCGLPTEKARIKEGDTVVDLGSGAGNDVFIVRRIVGEKGRVIGIDMTEAMIEKARANNRKLGYENVEFVLGDIEAMPLDNEIADVVVSNCVLNLVPDKEKAFKEIHRILKSGGHCSISDIVIEGELPEGIRQVAQLYAGCISGAINRADYLDIFRKAGLTNVSVIKESRYSLSDELLLNHISQDQLVKFRNSNSSILSITVSAYKA